MSSSLIDILFKPAAFFEQLVTEKESLKIPALIVFAGSILAAAIGYEMGGLSATMMAGVMPGMESIIQVSSVIGALIGTFIFWLIAAGVFYLVSLAFRGKGSFTRVLEVVGYGYLPQIIGSVITLAATFYYLPRVVVPVLSKSALENPEAITAATTAFMHDPAMMEFTQVSSLIAIVFMLWSANIWIFGIHHGRGLSMRDAAICVGAPVVLYILYVIYTLGAM